MFETLTERLSTSLRSISGTGQLTEDNIKDTLREVRMALLEADVALPVTRDFVSRVKDKALGQEVLKELAPGQAFVKIVYDELTEDDGQCEPITGNDRQTTGCLSTSGIARGRQNHHSR
ncbi:MAG: signal recognition particle receptor subunit alpha [Moraxella sp.]